MLAISSRLIEPTFGFFLSSSIKLFIGILFENAKLRLINMIVLCLLLFLLYKNFWIYGKTLLYYNNFIAFASGKKNVNEYRGFFDWYVNRDYNIAQYIKANTNDNDTVFIWGDNAQIYVLSERLPVGRYTVSYHVTFYPNAILETKAAIEKNKPAFIIAIRDDFPASLLDKEYSLKEEMGGVKIYERRI